MAYVATAIQVMIASPSDVPKERAAAREVIAEWNAVNSRATGVALMPVGWETHSSPELGSGSAQDVINERLLDHSDLVVGIFWTRVGSPTGKAISGSVEEIERHLDAGRPVMLYFSQAPVTPDSVDPLQYAELAKFKTWAQQKGIIQYFEDLVDFEKLFSRQLAISMRQNTYLSGLLRTTEPNSGSDVDSSAAEVLSVDAKKLLLAASENDDGSIMILAYIGGMQVQAGRTQLADGSRKDGARWKAAVEELVRYGLAEPRGNKGEVFGLTHAGYMLADELKEQRE
jgi:hypothetical protein